MKRARIHAHSVEVACPHCDASQPNPDNGGFPWLLAEVRAAAESGTPIKCAECDEPFTVALGATARCA